jgi:hypothetical protein
MLMKKANGRFCVIVQSVTQIGKTLNLCFGKLKTPLMLFNFPFFLVYYLIGM